jgi:hypothetical protein
MGSRAAPRGAGGGPCPASPKIAVIAGPDVVRAATAHRSRTFASIKDLLTRLEIKEC